MRYLLVSINTDSALISGVLYNLVLKVTEFLRVLARWIASC